MMDIKLKVFRTFSINVKDIRQYLISLGWTESTLKFEFVERMVAPDVLPGNEDIICILPLQDIEIVDKHHVIENALRQIACYYDRDIEDVIDYIQNVESDSCGSRPAT